MRDITRLAVGCQPDEVTRSSRRPARPAHLPPKRLERRRPRPDDRGQRRGGPGAQRPTGGSPRGRGDAVRVGRRGRVLAAVERVADDLRAGVIERGMTGHEGTSERSGGPEPLPRGSGPPGEQQRPPGPLLRGLRVVAGELRAAAVHRPDPAPTVEVVSLVGPRVLCVGVLHRPFGRAVALRRLRLALVSELNPAVPPAHRCLPWWVGGSFPPTPVTLHGPRGMSTPGTVSATSAGCPPSGPSCPGAGCRCTPALAASSARRSRRSLRLPRRVHIVGVRLDRLRPPALLVRPLVVTRTRARHAPRCAVPYAGHEGHRLSVGLGPGAAGRGPGEVGAAPLPAGAPAGRGRRCRPCRGFAGRPRWASGR